VRRRFERAADEVEVSGVVVKALSNFLASWSPRRTLFVVIVATIVVLDQTSKFWAVGALTDIFEPYGRSLGLFDKLAQFFFLPHPTATRDVTVVPSFWRFIYAENPGAAWSFLAGSAAWFRRPFFLLVAAVAMVFILVYYRRTVPSQRLLRIALALVFGGALGNFLDRARGGYVIDFVQWHWYDRVAWPTFNVADAAISIGVGVMLLEMLLTRQQAQGERARPAKSAGR
jgi:signal peptidase II